MVTVLATTAVRISEVSGLRVGDVDLGRGLIHVSRQTYPGRGGVITTATLRECGRPCSRGAGAGCLTCMFVRMVIGRADRI